MLASNQHGMTKTGYTYPLEAVVAKKKKKTKHENIWNNGCQDTIYRQ